MLVRGAPPGAGGIEQDGVPRGVGQGQGFAGPRTGHGLQQIERGEIAAQVGEAGARRLVAEHQPAGPHELREQARLAAGAGAHVQHPAPGFRREGQRREHGRTVLNVYVPPEGGEAAPERERFGDEPPGQRAEGFRFENESLRREQFLDERNASGRADQPEGTAESGGVCHGILF